MSATLIAPPTTIAVIAHRKKMLGGGLTELRHLLAERGYPTTAWYEVDKSRKAPAKARQAIEDGANLLLLWGGDGTVQRCIDEVAGSDVTVGILPAGTANLLAHNLGIPHNLSASLDVALHGARRPIDLGVLNGERFAVMAGCGLDAIMMKKADGDLKDRLGRLSYVWTGALATQKKAPKMKVTVDGIQWFKGRASCILLGNMGRLTGGLTAFPDSLSDDGLLEIGVVTAEGAIEWARVLSRLAAGHVDRSPLAQTTRGAEIHVKLDEATPYELDGGARKAKKKLRIGVERAAVTICVPNAKPV